jgi:retron-type reverse transcriptase
MTPDRKRLEEQLFCAEARKRLQAVPAVARLTPGIAMRLLKRGVEHWDRELRKACLARLVGLTRGSIASVVPLVRSLVQDERVPRSFAVALLLKHEERSLVDLLWTLKRGPGLGAEFDAHLFGGLKSAYAKRLEKREREELLARQAAAATRKAHALAAHLDAHAVSLKLSAPEASLSYVLGSWAQGRSSLDRMYREKKIPKRKHGFRMLEEPEPALKIVQRSILHTLLDHQPLHPACHGFRSEHSTVTNAEPHVGQFVVINLDLKNFFPSVTAKRVYGVLRQIGVEGPLRRFLTDVLTRARHLPQGGPASPMLANLVVRRLDSRLAGLAQALGARYTRYADDLTFSGPAAMVSALPFIRKIIAEEGFQVAPDKERIARAGARQEVTGLTVNTQVSVPRSIRRRLRAAVHAAANGCPPHWQGSPLSLEALRGHLAYLNAVQPDTARKLKNQLNPAS